MKPTILHPVLEGNLFKTSNIYILIKRNFKIEFIRDFIDPLFLHPSL